jgi:hypothetical protein
MEIVLINGKYHCPTCYAQIDMNRLKEELKELIKDIKDAKS